MSDWFVFYARTEEELVQILRKLEQKKPEIRKEIERYFPICPRCGKPYSCVVVQVKYWRLKTLGGYRIRVYIAFKHRDGSWCHWGAPSYFKCEQRREYTALSGDVTPQLMDTVISAIERFFAEYKVAERIYRELGDTERATELEIECTRLSKRMLKEILKIYLREVFKDKELLIEWIRKTKLS